MDFSKTVDLIIKDLNEAREIIDDLKNYPGVPALQVELAKSKCKSASEVIALLKDIQKVKTTEIEKNNQENQEPNIAIVIPPEKETSAIVSSSFNGKDKPSKKSAETSIFADTFNNMPESLNKKLGSLRDEDEVSGIYKTKRLTNLTEAIGVNDKFLFLRELFNGNQESYNNAISSLEEVKTLADAKAVIMGYTKDNNETDAMRQLLDLVKRKFSGNE